MAEPNDVVKALFGDEESAVVKSGTLAVTRLTGWVAAGGLALTNTEVFGELSGSDKLWGSIAIVGVFAFIAAADAVARGYATAHAQPDVRTLPSPLRVSLPDKAAEEEKGWKAYLLRFDPKKPEDLEFWVAKDEEALWVRAEKIRPA
jgi:hypothetical protein